MNTASGRPELLTMRRVTVRGAALIAPSRGPRHAAPAAAFDACLQQGPMPDPVTRP